MNWSKLIAVSLYLEMYLINWVVSTSFDPFFLQQCCQTGEKSLDSKMTLERENISHSSTIQSLEQVDCIAPAKQHSLSQVYSSEFQEQCTLFHKVCCLRRKEFYSCQLGKKLATSSRDECPLPSEMTIDSRSNLMSISSTCCTMCRSLTNTSRSLELCSSKSRSDYLRQFGADFHECCPVLSGSFKVLIRNTDASTSKSDTMDRRDNSLNILMSHKSSNYTCYNEVTGECKCSSGFKLQNRFCIDINECQLGTARCPSDHRCDNTHGSYICVRQTTCGTGYTWNHDLRECEDNNECTDPVNPCPSGTQCRNIRGSYRCDFIGHVDDANDNDDDLLANVTGRKLKNRIKTKCLAGFQLSTSDDSTSSCVDVDECVTRVHACPPGTVCKNIIGSYLCQKVCPSGFVGSDDEATFIHRCVDLDECKTGQHSCSPHHVCLNTIGSFTCKCPPGYDENTTLNEARNVGSPRCSDIDECTLDNQCSSDHICINTPGSYKCINVDCKLLGNGFSVDINNRNRCKRLSSCSSYFSSIGIKGGYRPSSIESSCREEVHAFTFLSLPSNVTLGQNSSRLELLAIRTAQTAKCSMMTTQLITDQTNYNINLPSAIYAYQSSTPVSDDHFSLIHQPSQSIVRVGLVKPLIGPQTVSLRVTCTSISHRVIRAVTDILISVSRFPF